MHIILNYGYSGQSDTFSSELSLEKAFIENIFANMRYLF